MLTGKAKIKFEKWYDKHCYYDTGFFYDLGLSMQWGVYQDFSDSLGIDLEVYGQSNGFKFSADIYKNGEMLYCDHAKTRNEARESAIEKLNEILNDEL